MAPVPLFVFAFKASAAGGLVGCVTDFCLQVVEKKLLPIAMRKRRRKSNFEDAEPEQELAEKEAGAAEGDEDDEELVSPSRRMYGEGRAIDALRMIKAFGVGSCAAAVGGTIWYGYKTQENWRQVLVAVLATEGVWFPLHSSLLFGRGELIEENVPRLFGYMVFASAGGLLVSDSLIKAHYGNHASRKWLRHFMDALSGFASTTIAGLLFVFTNKFADLQRNKTILHKSRTVDTIQFAACTIGQGLGNLVVFHLAITSWLVKIPVWWFPSMIVAPAFFYCTALNIENGVQSSEINGRTEPTPERRAEGQKRVSVMQSLPLGALPSGFVKGKAVAAPVFIGVKVLAALCASTYIAYMQVPWKKYLQLEKGDYFRVERKGRQEWGIQLIQKEDNLVLAGVTKASPARRLKPMVGRELDLVNDEPCTTIEAWERLTAGRDTLNLDFVKKQHKLPGISDIRCGGEDPQGDNSPAASPETAADGGDASPRREDPVQL
eukprot:TRINITY_DN4795_c0_g1_i3.p1 TRINITY_DN4795_c0_g1~~TRINITY_DN4795_c0_g1_i3.p1  ORF type:complete len:492 (+),score=138.59 TRINITY_DN4795_c0_g1_i3:135-1610(+)